VTWIAGATCAGDAVELCEVQRGRWRGQRSVRRGEQHILPSQCLHQLESSAAAGAARALVGSVSCDAGERWEFCLWQACLASAIWVPSTLQVACMRNTVWLFLLWSNTMEAKLDVLYCISAGSGLRVRLAVAVAPVWVWGGVISALPHKEERFLYPVYPLVMPCSSAYHH
jgi:hypothetical protein